MSKIRNSSLFEQANTAAQELSLDWIRTVFRELCYQLWKDNWRVDHVETEGNARRCRLHLTVQMLEKAQAQCQRVADKWSQRMEAAGHFQAASWIQSVAHTEASSFFTSLNTVVQIPRNEDKATDTGSTQTDSEKNPENVPDKLPARKEAAKLTPLAALRELELQLEEGSQMSREQQEQYIISRLDEMGYSGKTYWPFDWDIIQEATRKMPQQLYMGTNTSEYGNNLKLKLVPKSSLSSEAKDDDNGEDAGAKPKEPKDWTESMVVEYKKLGAFQKRTPDANKRRKTTTNTPVFPKETPRPAVDIDQTKIPWNPQVSREISSPSLDEYIHSDGNQETPIAHTLLGALKPLGHIHHFLQSRVDFTDEPLSELATERKQKLRFTSSVKERVGKHQMEKVVTTNKVRSKIKYSLKESGLDANPQETGNSQEESGELARWWDLDLGECLLDLQDEETNTDSGSIVAPRKFYAFSSLEVCLADEDDENNRNLQNPSSQQEN